MYCIDANVLIQAENFSFPEDVAPGFWGALAKAVDNGRICVVHAVYREVVGGRGSAARWLKNRKRAILVDERGDHNVVAALRALGEELSDLEPPYEAAALNHFYEGADPWIVAYCSAYDHTIVTQETPTPTRRRKVKVPDVCALSGVNVRCIPTLQLLRELEVRLVLP